MPEFDLEAFVKFAEVSDTESEVTALVKNHSSQPVAREDAASVELTVFLFPSLHDDSLQEQTSLQFFRDVGAVPAGGDWEHTWTITGILRHASVKVRDSAGAELAHAFADL